MAAVDNAAIEERASFDLIRYANCWEDADILCAALRPAPGKRLLSIASGGDNSLALAAEGAEVVAADLSAAQLAMVELKMAVVRRLEREQALAFLGVAHSSERAGVLAELVDDLTPAARNYWLERPGAVAAGVIHAGKFESYFTLFRTRLLPLVHGKRKVRSLRARRNRAERERFYEESWNNWRWRMLFRVFFSRFVMGRLGRDPEFFRYVEGSVADRILGRARYALTELPTHENPYLEYILTGNFGECLPRYLRPEPFAALKERLDLLTLEAGPLDQVAVADTGGGFDGFNLSDIFEYMDERTSSGLYGQLLDVARPGARLAYWNMLVPRSCPEAFRERVEPLGDESARLFARDQAFFYSAFLIDEVR
jgi:S-adenosylmethionine-diacylglycerol 3-amino-3-carboxypropyl transferase